MGVPKETSAMDSIESAIPLSVGGTICAPFSQYTLKPLSGAGLCDAVMMIPTVHLSHVTEYAMMGVGAAISNR